MSATLILLQSHDEYLKRSFRAALYFLLYHLVKLLIVSFQHFNVCEVEKFMLDNVDKKSYNIFTVRQGSESGRAKKIQRNLKKELDKPEGK